MVANHYLLTTDKQIYICICVCVLTGNKENKIRGEQSFFLLRGKSQGLIGAGKYREALNHLSAGRGGGEEEGDQVYFLEWSLFFSFLWSF